MSDYRRMLSRIAADDDWSIEITRGDHIKLRCRKSGAIVFASSSPRDPQRALANTKALMRRLRAQAKEHAA